ncbi:MAG: putative phosphoglycerate mutase [Candidatus Azotimanducaceae bacterium]
MTVAKRIHHQHSKADVMELVLIRHGLPEKTINEDGTPANPPLSQQGHDQARRMAGWLKDEQIDRLYSSPMQRAYQTAEPLAQQMGLGIEVCEGVAEYDQQAQHYIPVEELKVLDYERWLRLMKGDVDSVDFAGFSTTVCQSLNELINDNAGKRVAVTCHGGVINAWAAHVMGFESRLFFNPNYTSINRFMASSRGDKTVVTLNEHAHILRDLS